MGDPETQVIMMRLKSSLVSLLEHALNGTLDKVEAEWDRRTALGAVMAAAGYPESPRKGDVIHGLAELHPCRQRKRIITYFHAGTARAEKRQGNRYRGRARAVCDRSGG